jgi:hypothetical protein
MKSAVEVKTFDDSPHLSVLSLFEKHKILCDLFLNDAHNHKRPLSLVSTAPTADLFEKPHPSRIYSLYLFASSKYLNKFFGEKNSTKVSTILLTCFGAC